MAFRALNKILRQRKCDQLFSGSATQSSVASEARSLGLFTDTALINSAPLGSLLGCQVSLKLDCFQPSGSFKQRGMAHLAVKLRDQGATKLISSSGGNAGLAISSVGSSLGMDVEVIVPESTKEVIITKIRSMGANVQVHGANWNAADELARSLVAADPKAEYVSPFDHPLLWEGHSTIIDELAAEMSPPSHLVVSVGGGGLLCGVLEGLARVKGWEKVAVVAVETNGAASFHGAWQSSPPARDYTIPSIDTIATSLGARRVTEAVLDRAVAHQGDFTSVLCTDEEVVDTLVQFANDHKLLVEPACAASLALAYVPRLRQHLEGASHVVFEVCGGSAVSLELIEQWTSSKQA